MIQNERDIRHEHVLDVARQMMTAARTAPKGKGVDIIEVALVTGDDVKVLSDKMVAMVEEHGMKFFLRDADNILSAEGIVLIGTHEQAQGLNCGHCGYATCAGRADTRVMFSAGLAAQRLDWLKGCKQVYAIPVSASSKNPFFDRKPKQ